MNPSTSIIYFNERDREMKPSIEYLRTMTDSQLAIIDEKLRWLACLEIAGVDNWEGHGEARRMFLLESHKENAED